MKAPFRVRAWGDRALFTDPTSRTDPFTYPVPPPSAAAGLLRSIYWHPGLDYQISRVAVFAPFRYDTALLNHIKSKGACVIEDVRTQRYHTFLVDVNYGIEFAIVRYGGTTPVEKALDILQSRLAKGQHYRQPYFGMREYVAHLELLDGDAEWGAWQPIADSMVLPPMPQLRHVPDQRGNSVGNDGIVRRVESRFARPVMRHGVVEYQPHFAADGWEVPA